MSAPYSFNGDDHNISTLSCLNYAFRMKTSNTNKASAKYLWLNLSLSDNGADNLLNDISKKLKIKHLFYYRQPWNKISVDLQTQYVDGINSNLRRKGH